MLGELYEQEAQQTSAPEEGPEKGPAEPAGVKDAAVESAAPAPVGNEDPAPVAEEAPAAPDGPEWADEARLDEVFATWTPGPPPDAPASEREMAEVESPARPLDDDLAAALSAAILAEEDGRAEPPGEAAAPEVPTKEVGAAKAGLPEGPASPMAAVPEPMFPEQPVSAAPEPPPVPVPVPSMEEPVPEAQSAPWQRSDDDILPRRRRGPRLSRRR